MLRTVTFTMAPGTTAEDRRRVLDEVRTWKGIVQAGELVPGGAQDELGRMCFAYVEGDGGSADVIRRLASSPLIESAQEPPARGLAAGA